MRELRVTWKPWPGAAAARRSGAGACAPTRRRSACWSTKATSTPRSPAVASRRCAQLRLALPDACVDRPVVRAGRLAARGEVPLHRVWAGTQNPHVLRADLAKLMGLADTRGRRDPHGGRRLLRPQRRRRRGGRRRAAVARRRRAGARAAHARAGACVGAQGRGAADAGRRRARCRTARVAAYDFETSYPSERRADAGAAAHAHHRAGGAGLRDGRPHRACRRMRTRTCASRSTTWRRSLRASWLRGVSALPNSFAHESLHRRAGHRGRRRPGRSSGCGT